MSIKYTCILICALFLLMFVFMCYENRMFNNGTVAHKRRLYNKQKWCLFFLIIAMSLMCAFRNLDTPDTRAYYDWYMSWDVSSSKSFFSLGHETEIGFELLSRFLKLFCKSHYSLYFGIIALIILTLSAKAIWDLTEKRMTVFLLFYSIFGFYYSFIVIRQGIALAIVLYTISRICKNKRLYGLKFLVGVGIACLFHYAALICLLMLPFFRHGNIKRETLFIVLIIATILSIMPFTAVMVSNLIYGVGMKFLPSYLQHKMEAYFSDIELSGGHNIITLSVFLLIVLFENNRSFKSDNMKMWLRIETVGLILMSIVTGISIAIRLCQSFLIAHCFLLPEANKNIGKVGNCLIITGVSVFYIYSMIALLL